MGPTAVRRRVFVAALGCVLFLWLVYPRNKVYVTSSSSSSSSSSSLPCPPCLPHSALSQDVSLWSLRWEEALQRGVSALPADLSWDAPLLARMALRPGVRVHCSSHHMWRGHGLSNWAAWLAPYAQAPVSSSPSSPPPAPFPPSSSSFSSSSSVPLIAFVPDADTLERVASVPGVHVVEIGHVLQPFVLCQRDPGSGMKIRAVLELVRRGVDVWYSDADVIWLRSPDTLKIEPTVDMAIQIYGNGDGVSNGNFGMNMGLFFCRGSSSTRLQGVFRKLFRAMTRSFVVQPNGGLDTCNDQNCFNSLLQRWAPELLCGWFFRGVYHAREKADAKKCIIVQLLDPEEVGMADKLGSGHQKLTALHMTTYSGGHTFGKMFALQEHGLWRGYTWFPGPDTRFLLMTHDDLCSEQTLKDALALALLSRRVLVLPKRVECRGQRGSSCFLESQFNADRMLTCNRALMGINGYWDYPDKLDNCTECSRSFFFFFFFIFFQNITPDLSAQCLMDCLYCLQLSN